MKRILAFAMFLSAFNFQCLSEETLKKFGFTTFKEEKISSPTVCTDLFKDHGTCVDEAEVKAALDNYQAYFKEKYKFYDNVGENFDKLNEKIQSLFDALGGVEGVNLNSDEMKNAFNEFETLV